MKNTKNSDATVANLNGLLDELVVLTGQLLGRLDGATEEPAKNLYETTTKRENTTFDYKDEFDSSSYIEHPREFRELFVEVEPKHKIIEPFCPKHSLNLALPQVEVDLEGVEQSEATKPRSAVKRIWHSPIVGVLTYSLMALIVLAVFLTHSGDGAPRDMFGFSALRVLSGSMQSEIPQNSLIVTRRVDADTLRVGDDITFFQGDATVVTHRIVGVHYNYENSGQRAFQTKGIENNLPDPNLVVEGNVIGRVVLVNFPVGSVVTFVQENLIVSALLSVMIIGLFASMRMIFGNKPKKLRFKNRTITG